MRYERFHFVTGKRSCNNRFTRLDAELLRIGIIKNVTSAKEHLYKTNIINILTDQAVCRDGKRTKNLC